MMLYMDNHQIIELSYNTLHLKFGTSHAMLIDSQEGFILYEIGLCFFLLVWIHFIPGTKKLSSIWVRTVALIDAFQSIGRHVC